MGEVFKITKELVNANTKADPLVLDLNGNIISTVEEKLNKWREQFESMLNHVVSSDDLITFCCWQLLELDKAAFYHCAVFSSHWGHYSSPYRQTSLSVQVL